MSAMPPNTTGEERSDGGALLENQQESLREAITKRIKKAFSLENFLPGAPETNIQVKCGGRATIIGSESVMKKAKIDVEAGKTSEIYAVPYSGARTGDNLRRNNGQVVNQNATTKGSETVAVPRNYTPTIKVKAGEGSLIVGTTSFVDAAYIRSSSETGVNTIRAVNSDDMSEVRTDAVGEIEKRPHQNPQQLALPAAANSQRALPCNSSAPPPYEDHQTSNQGKKTPSTTNQERANPNYSEAQFGEINPEGFQEINLGEDAEARPRKDEHSKNHFTG